jgi:hypothetical protein
MTAVRAMNEKGVPLVYDLYCGHGGVGLALEALGFEHVGVDIEDRGDSYPGEFVQADASRPPFDAGADLVWASPPCLAYSSLSYANYDDPTEHYPTIDDLRVRELAEQLGSEYVIENVPGCEDLRDPTRINGLAFGAGYDLERWFETSFPCPDAVGTGEPDIVVNTRSGRSQSVKELADAKGVPSSWGKQGVRSAIPREYVYHLLHYCPSTPDVPPTSDARQSMLTEVVA